ncbi:MAG: hypothetical protein NC406_06125 [Bacteroides sp.]|nr:hypothetical protein [Bacteroides sp.]MCM1095542.1 hypothetical protein [Terasakiella sp.]
MIRLALCAITAAAALAACNDDVFLGADADMPDVTEATVGGDGGEAVFAVPARGLLGVSVWHTSDFTGLTCYDRDGNIIPENSPASELARISSRSMYLSYDIYIDGGRITLRTEEHPAATDGRISIRLDYDYGVRNIEVTVLPGRPLEVAAISYGTTFDVSRVTDVDRSMTYRNDAPLPQLCEVRPWLGIGGRYEVDVYDTWANGISVDVCLPERGADGIWSLGEPRRVDFGIAYHTYVKDWNHVDRVTIPPYSYVTVASEVTSETVVTGGAVTFRAPVSGTEYHTIFKTTLTEPISYEIHIVDVD